MDLLKRNQNQEFQNRLISILSALTLIAPSLSYAILGDAPLISIIAVIFLVLSILKRYPVTLTVRSVVYSLTISFIFTVILNITYPVDGDRFFSPLPTEILFPFLIAIGICVTFFSQNHITLSIIITLALFAMALQGSCVNDPRNVRLMVPFELWQNRFWVFGFFLFIQMAAIIPLLYFAQEQRSRRHLRSGKQHIRLLLYSASLSLLVFSILISSNLALKAEKMMEPFFNSLFTMYISSHRSKIVFGSEVDLYRKMGPNVQKNKNKIVLRAKSDGPPGYLRGRVYTSYSKGKWQNSQKVELKRLPAMANQRESTVTRFYRGKSESEILASELSHVDVFPSRFFYSDVLLAPGSTEVIEIVAESLESSQDGVFFPKSWDKGGAYSLSTSADKSLSAFPFPRLQADQLEDFLTIPDTNLQMEISRIGNAIVRESSTKELQKINDIENYLLSNFNYNLGTVMETGTDPILQFLQTKKSGHCELFATAAALLLREQGIATRYVTGFVAVEPHPKQDYWVARLGDCHAWVEAWLPEKKEWILVEATPPIGIPQGTEETGSIGRIKESLIIFWQGLYIQVKRGYFAEAVMAILTGIGHFLVWLFWRGPWIISWGILLIGLGVLYRFLSQKIKRRATLVQSQLAEFHSIYSEIESCLNKVGINRTETMSIRDLISVTSKKHIANGPEAISLLSDYECLRYNPAPPTEDQVTRLKGRVRLLKTGRQQ